MDRSRYTEESNYASNLSITLKDLERKVQDAEKQLHKVSHASRPQDWHLGSK
jgi:hypothetical protein